MVRKNKDFHLIRHLQNGEVCYRSTVLKKVTFSTRLFLKRTINNKHYTFWIISQFCFNCKLQRVSLVLVFLVSVSCVLVCLFFVFRSSSKNLNTYWLANLVIKNTWIWFLLIPCVYYIWFADFFSTSLIRIISLFILPPFLKRVNVHSYLSVFAPHSSEFHVLLQF